MEPSSAEQADVRSKDAQKFALFKKIQANKDLLFGKLSNAVTKDAKDKKWEEMRKELIAEGHKEFECKTAVQMRDSMRSVTKTRTIGKLDKAKKTGTGGNQKFTELEKLLLAIVDTESPQVVGLDVSESGEALSVAEVEVLNTPIKPSLKPFQLLSSETGSGKKKPVKRSAPPSSINADIEYMIKKEKLRELRLKNRSLQLNNYEKEKRLGLFPGVVIPGAYDEEDVDDSEFMKLIGKELGDESFEKYF
uniref:Regulatory protein zeste n=1 Tax=Ditylenchus dipsaci TaxID=166011 RepID=A0A915CWS4_9BILA